MKKTIHSFIVCICLCVTAITFTNAQAGVLDSTFSADGKQTTAIGSGSDFVYASAIQADGKIVLGGASVISGGNQGFALARYNTNGSLDNTFGTGGTVVTNFYNYDDQANAIVIQPDGKIIAAGYANPSSVNTLKDFALVRYKTDGTLDSTFGTNGKVLTNFPVGYDDIIYAVTLQSDGKIVVAGNSDEINFGYDQIALARYKPNGSLDSTFGTNGLVTLPTGNGDKANAIAVQPDGKILVAGEYYNAELALIRFDTTGALDNTFGTGGIAHNNVGNAIDIGYDIEILGNGKILVAATVDNAGGYYKFGLVRYTDTGVLDGSFGTGGSVITDFFGLDDQCRAMAVQSDGKIVLVGFCGNGTNKDFALARYTANGVADSTFGTFGKVTTAFGTGNDAAYTVAIQPDNKIVAAGYGVTSNSDFAVARYKPGCTASTFTQNPVLCSGESITVGIHTYNTNGTYIDVLTNSGGCDSMVTTNLTIKPNSTFTQTLSLCSGESITVGSHTYTTGGTFTDVLTAANGCDSTVTTNLTVKPNSTFTQSLSINSGSSVTVGNNTYTNTGNYIDTLIASNGCDSIVTTNLTVITLISEITDNLYQINVSPNPFTDMLVINGTVENKKIILFDELGRAVVIQKTSAEETKLETGNLIKGVYMLKYLERNIKVLKF